MLNEIWQLPNYGAMTARDAFLFGLFGWFGSLILGAAANDLIKLPTRDNGGWRLNALGSWLTGIILGILIGNTLLHSFVAGLTAPILIGYIIYRVEKMVKMAMGTGLE